METTTPVDFFYWFLFGQIGIATLTSLLLNLAQRGATDRFQKGIIKEELYAAYSRKYYILRKDIYFGGFLGFVTPFVMLALNQSQFLGLLINIIGILIFYRERRK
jgi:hypothetical protein